MLVGIVAAVMLLMAKQDRPPVDGKLILASVPMTRAGLATPGTVAGPTFHILTEAAEVIDTEASDKLVTESAP